MPVKALKDFLDKEDIKYVCVIHSPAYTAQEIAASAHIPGREMAKTVMVKVNGKMAMAVLPAHRRVDLDALREAAGTDDLAFASERDFKELFPGCETGAMPPFGNLYDMDVFVDAPLEEDETIAFNAGTHAEVVKLAYSDFKRLVKPRIGGFGK
ncbi:MAG: YbaK/EbsC family protein [Verrucomicrobia bacterium]|nr:YbaK/EbsC family protein [Verrucomicrobiota bacterium]